MFGAKGVALLREDCSDVAMSNDVVALQEAKCFHSSLVAICECPPDAFLGEREY